MHGLYLSARGAGLAGRKSWESLEDTAERGEGDYEGVSTRTHANINCRQSCTMDRVKVYVTSLIAMKNVSFNSRTHPGVIYPNNGF